MSRIFVAVLLPLAAVLSYGALNKAPLETARRPAPPEIEASETSDAPDVVTRLRMSLSAYDGNPSAELAEHVFAAFSAIDERLADLRTRAAASAGGTRAELVIERIELERERAAQMERFAEATQAGSEVTQARDDVGIRYANFADE
jgi:hypothetical protein